jgi:hypothetical protein
MNLQQILVPILGVVFVTCAWLAYGWSGVSIAVTGIVMWMLLHFTRLTHVLKKAAQRPKGHVGSAVMLNARLKPGVNLLHVIAMTGSLGELLSPQGGQPEVFRWSDDSQSHVSCEFVNGKLAKWTLFRPPADDEAAKGPAP